MSLQCGRFNSNTMQCDIEHLSQLQSVNEIRKEKRIKEKPEPEP